MNESLYNIIANRPGFIAALDQSGGSTPKALKNYGVTEDQYKNEAEMFACVHDMRTRIISSPAFTSDKIVGTILFERTMDSQIEKQYVGDYLINKNIVPFIKIDKGLAAEENGVQLMKEIPDLDTLLEKSVKRNMFGTKMRSNILSYNEEGISSIVDQQFALAKHIASYGLVPIIEPEVNINAVDKAKIESYLNKCLIAALDKLGDVKVMLKLTLPEQANLYSNCVEHPNVLRVVALSGGYSIEVANEKLARNAGVVASFSRALLENLNVNQSEDTFNTALEGAIDAIYQASIAG